MDSFVETKKTRLKRTDRQRAKIREYLFVASILGVPIIFFLVFWLYVNFDSLLLSFQREIYDVNGKHLVFTWENYEIVFKDIFSKNSTLLSALKNTLSFYGVALFIVLPISLLMSYFVYKRIYLHKFFRTITYLPNIICSSALVVLYKYTFMAGGPYEAILEMLGKKYSNPFVSEDTAIYLLLIYNVIFGFGGNMVVFGGAMNSIDRGVLEAGMIDGCNWFQELIYLIIPMICPTISTILVLSTAGVLSSTGPILAMTGGDYNTSTLAFLFYGYATGAVLGISQDIYYASAVGLIMTILTFPIVLLVRKALDRD